MLCIHSKYDRFARVNSITPPSYGMRLSTQIDVFNALYDPNDLLIATNGRVSNEVLHTYCERRLLKTQLLSEATAGSSFLWWGNVVEADFISLAEKQGVSVILLDLAAGLRAALNESSDINVFMTWDSLSTPPTLFRGAFFPAHLRPSAIINVSRRLQQIREALASLLEERPLNDIRRNSLRDLLIELRRGSLADVAAAEKITNYL